MSWQRHFLALLPDEGARAALAAVPLPADATRTDPADLHLTLAFLGTLDASAVRRACDAADAVAVASAAPLVELDRIEHWPRARALCATRSGDRDPLGEIAAQLAAALAARGFATGSRPFRSHVTLARWRGPLLEAALALPALHWQPADIVLMASRGDERRPRYDILHRTPFARVFSPRHH